MIKWRTEIFLLIIAIISVVKSAKSESSVLNTDLRLPKTIRPMHYAINLETSVHNNGNRDYGGDVKIDINVVQSTNQVVLHHRGLNIMDVKLFNRQTNNPIIIERRDYSNVTEFLTITSSTQLNLNDILRLEIEFSGKLQTGTAGFYRSQYQVPGENEPRYLAATQFEPTRARSAFPCFDEPEWRTTFALSITHGSTYEAISNMVGVSSNNSDGSKTTVFPVTTATMPTYLLAFVVSDLSFSSDNPSDPLEQRIYATKNLVDYSYTSLYYSKEFLKTLESFVNNFKYQLPKLYSAALPDHGSAMENYGLILYKEQYLILERDPHPIEVYDVVGTITHELTHQFFGNVVTCKWWDQIWLNEGFATWGEFLLPELLGVTQDMEFHHLFNIKKTQNALRYDSRQSTRPMTFPTSTNAEISSRFDNIAYDKSGAVIRMFQYVTGDEKFRASLYRYLSDNKHESITSDELLRAFEDVVGNSLGFNFTAAFRSWENNKGYPVINVAHNAASRQFKITQKRYVGGSEEADPNDDLMKWFIPLSYTTGVLPNFNEGRFTDFFPSDDAEKIISTSSINGFDDSQWYIFNLQQHGYYRVNYDTTNWRNIIKVLNSADYTKIHVLNRAQLIDDALTMAFDGYLSYDIALDVASYLFRETEYYPWYSAAVAFDKIDIMLKGTKHQENFKKFVRHLIQKMQKYYGSEHVPTDSIISQLARELANDLTCRTGDEACLKNSYEKFKAGNIRGALQTTFYCNAMKDASYDEAIQLYNKMHASEFQTERLRIIDGLLCSSDKNSINFLLGSLLNTTGTFYRSHERRRIFNGLVAKSDVGLEVLTNFIRNNHVAIRDVMGEGFIEGLLVSASARITHSDDLDLLSSVLSFLRNEPSFNISEKTDTDIQKNILNNNNWLQSPHFNQLTTFMSNYANSIWRLPKTSIPSHYEVYLDARNVQTGALPFSGEVRIDAEIIQQTDVITIHSKNQDIEALHVTNRDTNAQISILAYTLLPETDQMSIFLMQALAVGTKIQIHAKYSTELLTEIDGLYRDWYYDNDGFTVKYLATTQFQAVEARRVFPNYDEPALKATFKVSITHDETYSAVANMPVENRINNLDGTFTTHFQVTPFMSSYLNAFLISDFEALTNEVTRAENETLQGIWTRPGESQRAQYGLDNSIKILSELEKFVNVKFNLPKLDSGAIPGKGGGMENYGLVLYREGALIYESDISHSLMQRGVRLISHEIVHMFFGNLVTGEWWNYLWLNEGFATDFMYSLLEDIYPDWHMKEFFSRNIMIPYAFTTDAVEDVRSMSSELITTSDINNSFDDIAYDKAACVLRMVGYTLGEDLWRASLHYYLQTNKNKAVNSQHLIDAVKDTLTAMELRFPEFERFFRTWENQGGYPLVTAIYDSQRQGFVLTQKRFVEGNPNKETNSSWFIPINFATQENPNFDNVEVTHYMLDGEAETLISSPGFNTSNWYIFNKQQIGYYRVQYNAANWKAISDFLHTDKFEEIHVVNRMHLLDNIFVFAHEFHTSYQLPYNLATYLVREKSFFPWDIFMDNINHLYEVYGSRDSILNRFMYHMSKNFYAQYKLQGATIPNEIMPVRYGRELAYFVACNAGNEDCLADTKVLGKRDANGIQMIPRGLEDPILCNYFKQESIEEEWTSVWRRMNKLQQNMDYTLKTNLINALACTNNADFLYEHLESSLGSASNNVNYTQSDRRNVFNAVLRNELGLAAAYKLMHEHANSNAPMERYGWSLRRILMNMADAVYTENERNAYLQFLTSFSHSDFSTALRFDLSTASNANILARSKPENYQQMEMVIEILEREFEETTSTTTTTTTTSTTSTAAPPSSTDGILSTTRDPGAATAIQVSFLLIASAILISIKF